MGGWDRWMGWVDGWMSGCVGGWLGGIGWRVGGKWADEEVGF